MAPPPSDFPRGGPFCLGLRQGSGAGAANPLRQWDSAAAAREAAGCAREAALRGEPGGWAPRCAPSPGCLFRGAGAAVNWTQQVIFQ